MLMMLVLLVALGGLGTAVFFVSEAQDLSDVGGYGPAAKASQVRDMKSVLKNAIDRNYPVTLSEAEINQWLRETLTMKQGGILGEQFKLERFWVRLQQGQAELIMERSIFGKSLTVSMFFKVDKEARGKEVITTFNPSGGPMISGYEFPQKGGRLGQLVVPQGFLHLMMPAYQKVGDLFKTEIELAFERMHKISFESDRIVLDPREVLGDQGMPQTF